MSGRRVKWGEKDVPVLRAMSSFVSGNERGAGEGKRYLHDA